MAAAFLMPALLGSFWRRSTAAGAIAAMATGTIVTLGLYVLGTLGPERLHLAWLLRSTQKSVQPARSAPITCSGSTLAFGGLRRRSQPA